MKRTAGFLILEFLLASLPAVLFGDNRPFDRAQLAMKLKDYPAAITLCLDILKSAPADYDVNFLLARAYAYSGEREKAMARLANMESLFPGNADVILAMARIHTWKGQYAKALARYTDVLAFVPGNEEALVGTADIAARQRDYTGALSILRQVLEKNPKSGDAYYHLGLVYQWQGNRGEARANFEYAYNLDPDNEDYQAVLTRATPRLEKKSEIRYGHEVENWSDGRADFQNDRLALHLDLPRDFGALILKWNQTRRFGVTGHQFGVESYPRLWSKAYGRFEMSFSPKSDVFPRSSYLLELYQGLFSAAEASFGVGHMRFPDRPVTAFLGSLGYFLGNYYSFVRANYCRENGNSSFSWVVNLRRYFSDDNFVYLGYGRGMRLLEDLTVQDLLPNPAGIYLAGVTWSVFRQIRLEAHVSRISDNSLSRNTFQITAGYRWR
jgi:YaiO family outer membrane protein